MSDINLRPIADNVSNDDFILIQNQDAGLGVEKRISKSKLVGGVYNSIEDFIAKNAPVTKSLKQACDQNGPGSICIAGKQYWCNGIGIRPVGRHEVTWQNNLPEIPVSPSIGMRVSDPMLANNPFVFSSGVRALPTLPSITNIIFIDPDRTSDGNGSFANPWRLSQLPADFSGGWTNNTAYLFKRGTAFQRRIQLNNTNVLFGSYGAGPKPEWDSGSDDRCLHMNGANSMVMGIAFSSNTNTRCITMDPSTPATTVKNNVIFDCSFTLPGGFTMPNERTAVKVHGRGNKVLLCQFENIADDAIWTDGNDVEIAYCHFDHIGLSSTVSSARGDCIQLAGAADNPYIHHNYLRNRPGMKQCIEGSVSGGTVATVEYNIIIHDRINGGDAKAIKLSHANTIVRRNIIAAANSGVWCENNATVESNLILLDDPVGASGASGIVMVASGGVYTIQNNTIVSPANTGARGARYAFAAVPGAGSKFVNNIVKGFAIGFESIASSGWTVTNNDFFANTVNSTYTLNATNLTLDPLFDERWVPQEFMLHHWGASGAATDLYGASILKALGAIQPTAIDYDHELNSLYWSINGQ